MAFYGDVIPGEKFTPSAALSNDVRHFLNGLNGFGGNGVSPGGSGTVRIQVYNATNAAIPAGTAVGFSAQHGMAGDAVPAVPVRDISKPWGVVTQNLSAGKIGDCFISGPVKVRATGVGDFASPSPADPGTFVRGSDGAPVLFAGTDGKALINLGAGTPETYDGPFALRYDSASGKIAVARGYVSRNGEFTVCQAQEIEPADGIVCVETVLGNGEWSEPEIKIAEPARERFPIGRCRVTGSGDATSVSVSSWRVPVAVIIVAAECPLSAEADDGGGNGG